MESSNRVITNKGGQPRDLVRDSESAIRHSQILADGFENEAMKGPADQRDRLLNAARTVAQVIFVLVLLPKFILNYLYALAVWTE